MDSEANELFSNCMIVPEVGVERNCRNKRLRRILIGAQIDEKFTRHSCWTRWLFLRENNNMADSGQIMHKKSEGIYKKLNGLINRIDKENLLNYYESL